MLSTSYWLPITPWFSSTMVTCVPPPPPPAALPVRGDPLRLVVLAEAVGRAGRADAHDGLA
jgi:hypothetical protein